MTMTEDERVNRFEAAYNRVDKALTEMTERRDGSRRPFSAKVRIAAHRHRRLSRHVDFLVEIGKLRNALVHNRTGDDHYLAVPNEQTVLQLERIEQRMFAPEKVIPKFRSQVTCLEADQSLADAWALVRDDGYSKYPVYDEGRFVGLLTSNGFARWCADRVIDGRLNVDTGAISVSDVLAADHRRDQVEFVSERALIDDVDLMFSRQSKLEAVLITKGGRRDEEPLGMICAPDIAALSD